MKRLSRNIAKIITANILLLIIPVAFGQNFRWDAQASTTTGTGQMVPVLALPGTQVNFFTGCTVLPCTTPAVTYQSGSSTAAACPASAPIIWQLPLPQTCQATADTQGNFGGWFQPGQYQYVIQTSGHVAGPYTFGVSTTGGAGGSPPVDSVQFYLTPSALGSDPNITINPTAHSFTVAGSGSGIIGLCGATSGACFYQTVSNSSAGQYFRWPLAPPMGTNPCLVGNVSGTQAGLPLVIGSWAANCGGANSGWATQVASTQGASDTTITLANASGLPLTGTFFVDSEYESYTGITGSVLTGIVRGVDGTTPASHNPGAPTISVNVNFGTTPGAGYFSTPGTLAVNNGFPTSGDPFVVNSGSNETDILNTGAILQVNNSAISYLSDFQLGVPQGHNDGTNYHITVTDTSSLVQDNAAHELASPIGDSGGWAGVLAAIPAPSVGAATLVPQFIGAGGCNITYVVTGVDADGIEVPGTAVSISGLNPWSFPGQVAIRYPSAAGVVSYNAYRTVVSAGCVGLATGKFASGITGNYGAISDSYTGGDSSSPPGSNLSVAKSCIGSAGNHELFCRLAGAGTSEPVSCTSGTAGWEYVNVSATSSPFVYKCTGSSWVTAY